jgi:ketosteroid isomerase-like protein
MRTRLLSLLALLFLAPALAAARQNLQPDAAHVQAAAVDDSAAVSAVVDRFHEALVAGDSTAVLAMLAEDARILENGAIESKEEYRSHHLPADIAFARAVDSQRSPLRVTVRGDVAWATSTSAARGEFRGREVNSQGAEIMVLTRTPEGWRISAIHWSSRALRS